MQTVNYTTEIDFTKYMEEGKITDVWKTGHILAVHKIGSKTKPEKLSHNKFNVSIGQNIRNLMLIRDENVEHMTNNNILA